MQSDELLDQLSEKRNQRRNLLPTWIKVFLWIFMVLGGLVPLIFILSIFGYDVQMSLYGFSTNDPYSLFGIIVGVLFLIKGAVSFGLWTGQDWAVRLAIFDAILGIVICSTNSFMLYEGTSFEFNFRLELLFIIPYLIKMTLIAKDWARMTQK